MMPFTCTRLLNHNFTEAIANVTKALVKYKFTPAKSYIHKSDCKFHQIACKM